MRQFLRHFGITRNLGRCRSCMRASFLSAACVWLAAFVVFAVAPSARALGLAFLAAGATLSVLWLAHLTAYAARAARCRLSTATIATDGTVTRHSRRELVPLFAKAFALIAFATALPALASKAMAQDSTCPANLPYPCGTQYCCEIQSAWYCQGYTGNVQNWRQLGTFCTPENSDEAVADLRSNCAVLLQC